MNLRLGVVAIALGSVLGISACARDADKPAAPKSRVSVPPSGVICPGGAEPKHFDYDHQGYPTFSAMISGESQNAGAISIDLETQRIYLLREDGSAHTMTSWMGGSRNRWYPSGASICDDADDWADVSPTASGPSGELVLQVGHCWIEPVRFDGREWDVVEEDQFGGGGGQPDTFAANGTAWVAGDVLLYEDDSGLRLTLVPAGHPWTISRKGCD